jgi:hypothetical protein
MSTLDATPGFNNIDTVMQAAGTVHAYTLGALRAEITERRAERASGMTEQQWQTASGPYITRMIASGRYTTFDTGLDCVLDGIATRLGSQYR